jgi:hypothetical protein
MCNVVVCVCMYKGAIGGGIFLIGVVEAHALGITNIEQRIQWMAEKKGDMF